MIMDGREKLRKINEAELYALKATFDKILQYLHRNVDLTSASIDEDITSVRTETMEGFQGRVCFEIDRLEKLRPGRKNKYQVF